MSDGTLEIGAKWLEAMPEVVASERGEIARPARRVQAMSAARIKAIRKSVAKNTKEFERRFHIPAGTVEGWEQGRGIDAPAAALLRVIEKDPEAVERALVTGSD